MVPAFVDDIEVDDEERQQEGYDDDDDDDDDGITVLTNIA